MPGLKGFTLTSSLIGFYTLLAKPDCLNRIAILSHNNVRLGGMARCALGFVETFNSRCAHQSHSMKARVSLHQLMLMPAITAWALGRVQAVL